ncbi:MAG TPA: hypothetical protein VN922_16760 [Bacteroidia bacterium]|nr:hypothetical protein [Bacteroidia bacterium]
MRKQVVFATAMMFICCPFIVWATNSNKKHSFQSIEKAESAGIIKLKIKGNGNGYSGNCIDMTIMNTSNDSSFYLLEAGRRLKADDPTTQDILVAKEQELKMAAKEIRHIKVFGFCCQNFNHAPSEKSKYGVGRMAAKKLVDLAEFLNKNTFTTSAMQNAVWSISDNMSVASITDVDGEKTMALRTKAAEIKGVPVPSYTITYANGTSESLRGNASLLSGQIDYYLASNSEVEVGVFNEQGVQVMPIMSGLQDPDKYNYPFNIDVKGWPQGKYFVRVFVDGRKAKEKDFEL